MAGDPIFTKKRGTADCCDCTCHSYYASGIEEAAELKKKIDNLEAELAFQKRMNERQRDLSSRKKREHNRSRNSVGAGIAPSGF